MNLVSRYQSSESRLISALRQALAVLVLPCTFALFPQPTFALIELTGANKLTAGQNHTCTLTTAGTVKCWGANSSGQLGDNTVIARALPTEVPGLANITVVAAGDAHTCALTNTGGVKCWGNNANGQLGDNSTIDRLSPVNVSGLATGVIALIAGVSHTCAITAAGGVKCWGFNGGGQLGKE